MNRCGISALCGSAEQSTTRPVDAIDKRTQRICACSANIDEFVAKAPDELLGENWSIAFRPNQLPSLFKPADAPGQQFSHIQKTELHARVMLSASHSVDDITLAEMEYYHGEPLVYDFAERVSYLQQLPLRILPTTSRVSS